MIVMRFTQKLLKDMRVSPEPIEDISELFSWHANIIKRKNKKCILLVNDLSRLSILLEGIRTSQLQKLTDSYRTVLTEYLKLEGVEQTLIEQYLEAGEELVISKTNSRSVLGTMNEITFFASEIEQFEDSYEFMKWLNQIIHKPIDYNEPIKVFREAISEKLM